MRRVSPQQREGEEEKMYQVVDSGGHFRDLVVLVVDNMRYHTNRGAKFVQYLRENVRISQISYTYRSGDRAFLRITPVITHPSLIDLLLLASPGLKPQKEVELEPAKAKGTSMNRRAVNTCRVVAVVGRFSDINHVLSA